MVGASSRPAVGRPSTFTQELADTICERLADGESLRKICKSDDMPDRATVSRWLAGNEVFRDQYARARVEQAHFYAEEIVEIADDAANDYIETEEGRAVDKEHIQRARLRVDARKWYASKLAPKVYGDKLELAGDKDAPFTLHIHEEMKGAAR